MDNCKMNQPGWHSNAPYMPYRNMRQSMPVDNSRSTCPSCRNLISERKDICSEQKNFSSEHRDGCSNYMNHRRDFMMHMPVAMAYVPWQTFTETFDLCKSLEVGTIFPELCLPFCGVRRKCR